MIARFSAKDLALPRPSGDANKWTDWGISWASLATALQFAKSTGYLPKPPGYQLWDVRPWSRVSPRAIRELSLTIGYRL
jgi:hypothetical protein